MEYKQGPWLKEYIKEVYESRGKGKNQQLFEAINNAVNKVLNDPTSKEFSKHTIDPYKAVDVLPQIRLFFIIENQYDLIFFTWLNNLDKFPHDSSKGERDKCYLEFKRLKDNGKLDQYEHKEKPEPNFKINGKFRLAETLYASLSLNSEFACSNLELNKIDNNEYLLEHINENDYESQALILLIENICKKAKESNINLSCLIDKSRGINFMKSVKHALLVNGFNILDNNDEYTEFQCINAS